MRVGLLQTLGLGDFLTAIPAIRAVRRHFEGAELAWVGKPEYAELIEPIFDGVVELRSLTDPIEIPAFDLAVNLHGSGPMSHQRLFRSGEILGFHHEKYSPLGPAWSTRIHMRSLWISLLAAYGIRGDPEDFLLPPAEVIKDHVVIHVDSRDRDRWWPLERFEEVSKRIDRPVEAIGARLHQERSLYETLDLVKTAALVISVDSGIAHLAYAFKRPSVTLFGPAPALRWGPPSKTRHVVLGNLDSFDEIRPEGPTSRHLLGVTADDVLTAVKELLMH